MKKLKNIVVITLISIIFIGIFLFSSLSNKTKIKLTVDRKLEKKLILLQKKDLNSKYDLIKIFNDSIFLISWQKENSGKIFTFDDKDLKVRQHITLADKMAISNYYKNDKNNFTILNTINKNILKINREGEILKYSNIDVPISRGVLLGEKLLFTTWGKDLKLKLYSYNLTTKQTSLIQNKVFPQDVTNTGIIYDGVLKHENNQIILIPYSKNEVLFFDENFRYKSKMKLINHEVDFKFIKLKSGELMPDPKNQYPNIYSDVYENKLYVLTNEFGFWDNKDTYYIDVYDIINKEYINSYIIADPTILPREILVKDNNIYILGKNKLNIYEVKQ